jgi:hypothetical protein
MQMPKAHGSALLKYLIEIIYYFIDEQAPEDTGCASGPGIARGKGLQLQEGQSTRIRIII